MPSALIRAAATVSSSTNSPSIRVVPALSVRSNWTSGCGQKCPMPRSVMRPSNPKTRIREKLIVPAVSQIQGAPELTQLSKDRRACWSISETCVLAAQALSHHLGQRVDGKSRHEQDQCGDEQDAVVGTVDFGFRHLHGNVR